MTALLAVVCIATAITAGANWYSRAKLNDRVELISKPLTTVGAIAIATSADGPRPATVVAIVALALCLIGDVALLPAIDQFHLTLVYLALVRELIEGASSLANVSLFGGEEVRVLEAGRVFVVGNIKKPGAFRIDSANSMTILQALARNDMLQPNTLRTTASRSGIPV